MCVCLAHESYRGEELYSTRGGGRRGWRLLSHFCNSSRGWFKSWTTCCLIIKSSPAVPGRGKSSFFSFVSSLYQLQNFSHLSSVIYIAIIHSIFLAWVLKLLYKVPPFVYKLNQFNPLQSSIYIYI